MDSYKERELWFVTGSQHLYGDETLRQVDENSKVIAESLANSDLIPLKVIFKPVVTTPDAIFYLCQEANYSRSCVGLIMWMHTFSPAKMWIRGLKILGKPFLHFHTQFNRDVPWDSIDMNFMNLNQSAHGGREFGFIVTRLRLNRKVVVGHWQDREAISQIAIWARAAVAFSDAAEMKIARFGDNMRDVAVTEGDKVTAQATFNYAVYGYGVGNLVQEVERVSEADIDKLITQYKEEYLVSPEVANSDFLRDAAKIEIGMEIFLVNRGFKAFTTTFEDLHGLPQLPGIAVQRLMAKGYGFGAEGDWKTAALVRSMKVMGEGLKGGTSFMEDYTYNLKPGDMSVLGAHMLEICPGIAESKPRLEIHPLGIGGKKDPARLVFKTAPGKALNASVIDLGNRFRMLVNTVEVIKCPEMPKLPVASVLWKPCPDLKTAAAGWILGGGAHHTGFTQSLTTEYLEDFAAMAGIELLLIDVNTSLVDLKNQLRQNEIYYHLIDGIR
ncbi:MAG TPA: L-arabinose isomerase [Bacteroidales bacterium]|nr:L-arabinose isomerase [Bacteroidales bacterium]